MWPLAGLIQKVINNLNTLLDRFTSTRASRIDSTYTNTNTLTSRLTSTRARKLDDIHPSGVKTFQHHGEAIYDGEFGTVINVYGVDPDKTVLNIVGVTSNDTSLDQTNFMVTAFFERPNEVTVYRERSEGLIYVDIQIIEFY